MTPQVPGEMKKHTMDRITQLESMKMRSTTESTFTSGVAPRFTVPIENMNDLREGENAHFEARLIPTGIILPLLHLYCNFVAIIAFVL